MRRYTYEGSPMAAISAVLVPPDGEIDSLLAIKPLIYRRSYALATVQDLTSAGSPYWTPSLRHMCRSCSRPTMRTSQRRCSRSLTTFDRTPTSLGGELVNPIAVSLPADIHQIDDTGYVYAFLDEAPDPARIVVGAVIVAGDPTAPFLARVVDVGSGEDALVHLDPVGSPEQLVGELRHTGLIST